ncbi:DUF4141 domain-containing protein [Bacteroides sp. CG01]|uniref:DUF4141 domain-containing protein n=1 Tax=Bacteroides sp. CG01 TaxID=3096000 RepID=UPI002AFDD366|nr:DUF4141 domain-containing protein [Bacteroides sp. CG01]
MRNLKKWMLLALFCTVHFSTYAQWAVIDPSNLAQGIINMGNNISAVSKTTGETLKVFQQAQALYQENKKYYDALLTAKDFIKQTKKVGRSIQMVSDMSEMFIKDFTKFTSDPRLSARDIDTYMRRYNRSIRLATEELKELTKIVGNGLSMSDKERMDRIDHYYSNIYSSYSDLKLSQLEMSMLAENAERKSKQKKMLKEFSGRQW